MKRIAKSHMFFFCLLFLAFVIPLSQRLSAAFIVVFFIFSFFYETNWKFFKRSFINGWDIYLYLFILFFGLTYSKNLVVGLGHLETSFPLFAFPFLFPKVINFSIERLTKTHCAFWLGLLVSCIFSLFYCAVIYFEDNQINIFFYESLTSITGFSATYLSYYLTFSITIGLYFIYFDMGRKYRIVFFIAISFSFFVLMLLTSKTTFISLLLVCCFFILKFLVDNERTDSKRNVFSISTFFLVVMFLISYLDLVPIVEGNYFERFELWKASIAVSPNLIFGAGTGDYNTFLHSYFMKHKLFFFLDQNYNAHNQFIQTLLSNGILGLVALLIMLIRPLVLSIRYQNPLGILVFFSFFIYGLTEVFLGRYQGVVFFALMHQTFIAHYHSQGKALAIKES